MIGHERRLRANLMLASGLALLAAPALAQEPPAAQVVPVPAQSTGATKAEVYEPAFFARFSPKTAADMVNNIPGFEISDDSEERGFGQASQNVLINGRRVSGKSNDAATALGRIAADTVVRIEIVDGATLDIPGLSGQVANVIAKVDALSGNWNIEPEFRENLQPSWFNGAVSANGRSGGFSWSAGLELQEFHNGHDGPGVITNRAGVITDVRREGFNGAGEEPELSATLTYETLAGSVANLNLSLEWFNFIGREDSFRNPLNQARENRFTYIGEDDRGGEIGADYEFDLGPGRLKLIGLQRYAEEWDLFTVETWRQNQAPFGERSDFYGETGESILRGEYNFGLFGGDVQWAAEGAFNFLDVTTNVGSRQADGSYLMAPLTGGTARVEERRAETNLSYSRKLSDRWSLQSSLGGEYSELTQSGAGGLTREFVRPKGFLAMVWRASDTLDVNFKAERRVGQLNFGDFLSSVDLQNNNARSGNVELVPEQSWIFSTEANKRLGPWGAVKLTLENRLIEDVVDQIPIDTIDAQGRAVQGSGVGNIDEATAWAAAISGTINFDPVGWKGVQFAFNWRYQDSEVDDPLTGIAREIGGTSKLNGNMSLRWDVPNTDWTLVAGIEEGQSYANYRLDQISRNWNAPSTNFFEIQHKDVFGMKAGLQVVNLNDTSENFKRDVFCDDPVCSPAVGGARRRTNPLDFTEERHRTFGPIVRFNLSGTF